MKKILINTSTFNKNNLQTDYFINNNIELIYNKFNRKLTELELYDIIDDNVIGLIAGVEPITKKILEKAVSLKVISRCGIGMDNVDLNTAKILGIQVINTPNAPVDAVVELTFGHIFSLLRKITESDRYIRDANWKPLYGNLFKGKNIGIIGFGRIGKKMAEISNYFGANVLVYDPFYKTNLNTYKFVDFNYLIKESDIITLHIPYNIDTHHIIGSFEFSLMKSNTLLLNISRGGLIDEKALYDALFENKIAGAALDCFESEPYTGNFTKLNNIQMTAHMGSYAKETRDVMESEAIKNLITLLNQ